MTELSKEALEIARGLCGEYAGGAADTSEVAVALQELMDERVFVESLRAESEENGLRWKQRAEQAEKNLAAFRHDKDVIVSQLEKRAELAEAEIGEFAKAMRDWIENKEPETVLSRIDKILFYAILNNYER